MDIRVLWLIMVTIVWLPAAFTPYDDLAIAICTVFSIVVSLITLIHWAEYKWKVLTTKTNGKDKDNV